MERRLAAILAADVVGYTRLMGEDEAGTLQRLKDLRAQILDPLIAEHHGRLVKLMGDGSLIEFASAVDAVSCAVAWQDATGDGAGEESANDQLQFRIGINLGDVMIDGDDLYGDGVNIASRLEALAEPGGICLSAKVYEEVRTKLDHVFDDLGMQEIKNVADPIRVYRIITGSGPAKPASQSEPKTTPREKPSIAVLPFDNMSGDPEQEFFADGITEDLITALSKIRWFFVIARNSTFSYKGQAVEVTQAAKELGVRYVLEGSVRRAGNRVRITAQLVDATTGHHVWAERYDRNIEDIFALQDEMTLTIVGAVEPELSAAERERALAKPPENLDAWETYQRGLWNMWRFQKESNAEAPGLLRRAHELDPNFATAYAHEAYAHYLNVIMGWAEDQDATLARGLEAAETALSIDDKDAIAWFAQGRILMMQGDHDASVAAQSGATGSAKSHK